MARLSARSLTCLVLVLLATLLLYFRSFSCLSSDGGHTGDPPPQHEQSAGRVDNITCVLNREVARNIGYKQTASRRISCKTDGEEVYVPFSFIKQYYEARGDIVNNKNSKTAEFEISHSYSKVYTPTGKYKPDGQFMHFRTFNVEARSRVLCVSAEAGVPVSTQWSPKGYHYPTQIAQFALSHYSSHIANQHKTLEQKTVIEDVHKKVDLNKEVANRVIDEDSRSLVIEFKNTIDFLVNSDHLIVCFDFKNIDGAGFKIFLNVEDSVEPVVLNYLPVDDFLSVIHGKVVFGFGTSNTGEWLRITRDVSNDLEKMINILKKSSSSKRTRHNVRVTGLQFSGHGQVTNISVSPEEHLRMFLHGADWFVANQDAETGGWTTPVIFNKERRKYPGAAEVGEGWVGAMCQGQAISVLVRAFLATKDPAYLAAAEDGAKVFNVSSRQGGVRAVFLDKYVWYEEYPTNPSTFILNGFMYSLLGLYDLKTVSVKLKDEAERLYSAGLESLAAMLPLYDTGSSTLYDLRHFTMKTAPKGARWDYHSTHINQLLELATIAKDHKIFKETAERWRGYMVGQRAAHN